MPLLTDFTGSSAQGWGEIRTFNRKWSDNFTRSNTVSGLGTSSNGDTWNTTRGNWFVNATNQAQCTDAQSNYSIASVYMGAQNQTVSANVADGTGVAFWLVDSNNWWSVTAYSIVSTYYYSCTGTCCSTGCTSYTCAGACNNGKADTNNCACGNGFYYWSAGHFGYAGDTNNCSCNNSVPDSNNCGCCSGLVCSSCTTICGYSTASYYLRLTNSFGGTITVPTSDTSLSGPVSGITVVTLNNSITATAYDGNNNLIGTFTYSASNPTKGNSVGIIKAPSYSNGTTITNFSASV
jgi:hypothetical protein